MFPFWDLAIWPVIKAAKARSIVEIGALRGETTVLMLDALGSDSEIHVIDPVPAFDPSEHEQRFPGRYHFHRDLSLSVLPALPPVDVALIDGDHNWYTVYHELRQLAATARTAGAPLPVMILHDVGWPYGRRDLYYAPEQIPEEFRQPYAQQGMRKGRKQLVPRGGLNPTMFNALTEGGPRNGVMTALDDFVAEHDRPVRRLDIPIYFGLSIVVEEAVVAAKPELAAQLDWLESPEGTGALLHLAEDTRLDAMLFQHNVFFNYEQRFERLGHAYLELLKGALLDEHYLENELRIEYLERCLATGSPADPMRVRDPQRQMRDELRQWVAQRRAGRLRDSDDHMPASYFPYTDMGRVRLDHLQRCVETLQRETVQGDLIECGTGRGGGAIFLRGAIEAFDARERRVFVADEFRSTPRDAPAAAGYAGLAPDLNTVRDGFERFGLLDDSVRFLLGRVEETLPDAPIGKLALLRIGPGLGDGVATVLDVLYDKITLGGFVIVDDGSDEAHRAVEEFRSRYRIADPLERVDWVGSCWRKTGAIATTPEAPKRRLLRRARPERAPLAPPVPAAKRDLSVVVVFYNMAREARRTLHSLSRAYQRDVEGLDYEVIVVDNGSNDAERLGEELVRSFGPEFRYVDLGSGATQSPADALNRGVEAAAGEAIAFMIDGAHVLTPGVLRYGMAGLATYGPNAIVATQQWYLGPGQQGDVMMSGYDQAFEDRLLDEIAWPRDGYLLFDIGHFIGDRDWFDGVWESNCLFVPRKLLEQVGGFDETFSMPGGGYANLEFYERAGSTPDVKIVTIIGEGSFHQVHGGTTTNQADADERRRRIAGYAQHYQQLRGRTFRGPGKVMHYVGSMPPRAIRSKARRRTAPNLFKKGLPEHDGMPEQALPIPEDLKVEFIDAFWRSLVWRGTTWLGTTVEAAPTDLLAYQEIVTGTRPEWIVDLRAGNGGRALFLASVCELLGRGRIIAVDPRDTPRRAEHPRITYLTGDPSAAETVARVRELVGADEQGDPVAVMVVVGGPVPRGRAVKEFNAYAPLVPIGSYIVMEDTVVNGHPVWPAHGPGPAEAVMNIINTRGDFAPDPALERYGLTLNPSGFLKRVL
jgi:cephalosporin hydroxylase